jgi:hypothetical protein
MDVNEHERLSNLTIRHKLKRLQEYITCRLYRDRVMAYLNVIHVLDQDERLLTIRFGFIFLFLFYPVCPMFYFVLAIRIAFYHPICHRLYVVMSICDVLYYC